LRIVGEWRWLCVLLSSRASAADDVDMSARRIALLVTCVVVAALGVLFAVSQWDRVARIATVASALAAVAAVGVAVWAALPGSGPGVRASRTGHATADGTGGRANSGVTGPATMSGPVVADRTGDAQATEGGTANSGVDLRP
jgi:hypothetical protein